MRCLIVDDNEMSRISLQNLCSRIEDLEIVSTCEHALEAIDLLKEEDVDLLLLDIEMPDVTGLELVRSLEKIPLIIFTTSKTEYAIEAFELKEWVVDYLTKPIKLPRLIKAIEAARNMLEKEEVTPVKDYLFIRSEGKLVRIDVPELLFIETVGDYVRFKTDKASYLMHGTIKAVDAKLQHPDLMKVNRSFIVNLSQVKDIVDHSILIGDKIIPVSRAHRNLLLKKINPI